MIYRESKYERLIKGARVALVGPASTLIDYPQGEKIDCYDLVARVNGHIPPRGKHAEHYGRRTDILYLNTIKRMMGVTSPARVVCLTEPGRTRAATRAAKNAPFTARLVRRHIMSDLIEVLGTKAHTGVVAVRELLDMGASEVFVAGFSFYSGPHNSPVYVPGYTKLKPSRIRRWACGGRSEIHNAQAEFAMFADWVREDSRITFDEGLGMLLTQGYDDDMGRPT